MLVIHRHRIFTHVQASVMPQQHLRLECLNTHLPLTSPLMQTRSDGKPQWRRLRKAWFLDSQLCDFLALHLLQTASFWNCGAFASQMYMLSQCGH